MVFTQEPVMLRYFVLAGASLMLPLAAASLNAAEPRPNFVIFIADDMNWNDAGTYGHPTIRTPHMDQLAGQGMRFDRAYLTTSSCSPSRASMMTGRYPHATGAGELHLPLPADQVMMTTPLREAGYWTAAVGKWHLGDNVRDQVDYIRRAKPAEMGQAWQQALKDRPKDKPFFFWAAHYDAHRPYNPDKTLEKPYTKDQVVVPPYLPDTPTVREDLAAYYNEVTRFDQHIGLILDQLRKQNVASNTFILVISDNGRPFPHSKTRVNTPGVKTPFIVRWPGEVEPGQVTDSIVSTVDIAPTVLSAAGLEPIDSFQGKSLMPVLNDPEAEVRQYAFAEHNWHDYRAYERAVHGKRFVYVRNWLPDTPATPPADAVRSATFGEMKRLRAEGKLKSYQLDCFTTPRPEHLLYDYQRDPHNLFNLGQSPAFSKPLKRLQNALANWRQRTDDVFPGKNQLTPSTFDRTTGERIINAPHPSFRD
jgi:arylsulfatase A-like enzyme